MSISNGMKYLKRVFFIGFFSFLVLYSLPVLIKCDKENCEDVYVVLCNPQIFKPEVKISCRHEKLEMSSSRNYTFPSNSFFIRFKYLYHFFVGKSMKIVSNRIFYTELKLSDYEILNLYLPFDTIIDIEKYEQMRVIGNLKLDYYRLGLRIGDFIHSESHQIKYNSEIKSSSLYDLIGRPQDRFNLVLFNDFTANHNNIAQGSEIPYRKNLIYKGFAGLGWSDISLVYDEDLLIHEITHMLGLKHNVKSKSENCHLAGNFDHRCIYFMYLDDLVRIKKSMKPADIFSVSQQENIYFPQLITNDTYKCSCPKLSINSPHIRIAGYYDMDPNMILEVTFDQLLNDLEFIINDSLTLEYYNVISNNYKMEYSLLENEINYFIDDQSYLSRKIQNHKDLRKRNFIDIIKTKLRETGDQTEYDFSYGSTNTIDFNNTVTNLVARLSNDSTKRYQKLDLDSILKAEKINEIFNPKDTSQSIKYYYNSALIKNSKFFLPKTSEKTVIAIEIANRFKKIRREFLLNNLTLEYEERKSKEIKIHKKILSEQNGNANFIDSLETNQLNNSEPTKNSEVRNVVIKDNLNENIIIDNEESSDLNQLLSSEKLYKGKYYKFESYSLQNFLRRIYDLSKEELNVVKLLMKINPNPQIIIAGDISNSLLLQNNINDFSNYLKQNTDMVKPSIRILNSKQDRFLEGIYILIEDQVITK